MDVYQIIGIVSSIATIISVPIAIIQTFRNRKLKSESKRRIWAQIETIKAIMRCLDHREIDFTYGLANEQFRLLLTEASLLEKNYSLETIKKWRKIGKLSSDWQERNALMLLETEMINEKIDVSESFSKYDEGSIYTRLKMKKFNDDLGKEGINGIEIENHTKSIDKE